MKRILLFSCLLSLLFGQLHAQVDDIKRKSDENRDKKDQNGEKDYYSTPPDDPIMDACFSSCAMACFDVFFSVAGELLMDHHRDLMKNRDVDPTVLSIDFMPHIAYSPDDDYINLLPRIRGTWGIFSTDFRFNYLAEFDNAAADIYNTWEWQILQLNLVAAEVFNFRIGTGLLSENYKENLVYNEHSIGFEFRSQDQNLLTSLEGRTTWDYETGSHVFTEGNLRFSYRFININHVFGYVIVGGIYQRYYESTVDSPAVNLFSAQMGLTFNIH